MVGTLTSILFLAFLNAVAVAKGWKRLEYFSKPAVPFALIAWLYFSTRLGNGSHWFAIGLSLSLAGDILLLIRRDA